MKKSRTLTRAEAAAELGISERMVRYYIAGIVRGRPCGNYPLPATTDAAGNVVVRRVDLEKFRRTGMRRAGRPKRSATA